MRGAPARRFLRILAWAGLAVSLAFFGWSVYGYAAEGQGGALARNVAWHAWPVCWLMLVSMLSRSRTLVNVVAVFLGGYFTSIWISVLLNDVVEPWVADDGGLRLVVIVPAIEEVAKLVPLATVVLAWWWRSGGTPGATDFGILGFASGAGFAVHEDAMWGRVTAGGLDSALGWFLPSAHTDLAVLAGHAVWTGLVGLTIGLWMTRRRQWWSWLLPWVALALVVADHGIWNSYYLRDSLRPWLLDGWLPIALFLVGAVAAVAFETVRVQRFTSGRAWVFLACSPALLSHARGPVSFVRGWRRIVLNLRVVALQAFIAPPGSVARPAAPALSRAGGTP